ncbi:DUF87 domain-containing protein [Halosimplex litoreum]|uniref:DUF87 domain-containing protein n=2 Tax=Halosimplex litoreum TaxID=1198301 RepID=A0A7U3WBP3_9EURY|nr:DUF87 domain-containing protein [Halosimplex litoreum]
MGEFVETYGALPSLVLLVSVFMILGSTPIFLNASPGAIRRRIADTVGRSEGVSGTRASASDGTAEGVRDAENEFVSEAVRRLQRRGEDVSGEALRDELEEIEYERSMDQRATTGAVPDADDRSESTRLSVAPNRIVESKSYIKRLGGNRNEKLARVLIISDYPSRVANGWLDTLFTTGLSTKGAEVRVSQQIWPRDSQTMKQKLNVRATRLSTKLQEKREKGKVNTLEEEKKLEHINRLRDELTAGSAKLFDFGLYFEVVAQDEDALDEGTQELKQHLAQSNARLATLFDRQRQSQRAIAPLADDPIRKTQVMDQRALATAFPFTDPTVVEPSGVLLGFHSATNSPVVVDRFQRSGHNMLITGKIGSGKSYLAKLAMWRRLMIDPDAEVLIIDPVGGFGDIVDAVDGQKVTINSSTIINPLEIKAADNLEATDSNPYDEKIRSVMGMFESHFEGRRELNKEEEGVLRRAIRLAYLRYGITKDPETHGNESPTLDDVLDVLRNLADGLSPEEFIDPPPESESVLASLSASRDQRRSAESQKRIAEYAQSVLLGLEDFQQGGQRANLNGETNVRLNERVVQFDLSNVADGRNEGLLMHIVLDWLFQRAKNNDGNMIVVIDEAHYMLGHDQSLDMLNLFVRHSRHYGSGLTLISQTVDEFMHSEKAKEIYDQCDIRALMRHQDLSEEACEALGFTERERNFVLQAQAGNSASYSESLLYVTGIGKLRMRVLSNDFEHHVVDGDLDAWRFLVDNEIVDPDDVPAHESTGPPPRGPRSERGQLD